MKKKINYAKLIRSIILLIAIIVIAFFLIKKYNSTHDRWIDLKSGCISISSEHRAIVITDDIIYKTLNYGYIEKGEAEGKRIKKGQVIGTFIASEKEAPENEEENNDNALSVEDEVEIDKNQIKIDANSLYKQLKESLKNKDNTESKKLKRELNYTLEHLNKLENENYSESSVFNENEKLVGSNTASIDQNFTILSSDAGVLSYYIDRLSGKIHYEDRYKLDYDRLFNENHVFENSMGKKVEKDTKIIKIIKNKKWYLLCESSLEDLDRYKIDDKLNLYFNNEKFNSIVVDKFKSKNTGIICLEIPQLSEKMAQYRLVNVTIESDEVAGVIIPSKAIVTINSVKGVYVKGVEEEKIFRPIQILGNVDENIIVSENSYTYKDENGNLQTIDTVNRNDKILVKGE